MNPKKFFSFLCLLTLFAFSLAQAAPVVSPQKDSEETSKLQDEISQQYIDAENEISATPNCEDALSQLKSKPVVVLSSFEEDLKKLPRSIRNQIQKLKESGLFANWSGVPSDLPQEYDGVLFIKMSSYDSNVPVFSLDKNVYSIKDPELIGNQNPYRNSPLKKNEKKDEVKAVKKSTPLTPVQRKKLKRIKRGVTAVILGLSIWGAQAGIRHLLQTKENEAHLIEEARARQSLQELMKYTGREDSAAYYRNEEEMDNFILDSVANFDPNTKFDSAVIERLISRIYDYNKVKKVIAIILQRYDFVGELPDSVILKAYSGVDTEEAKNDLAFKYLSRMSLRSATEIYKSIRSENVKNKFLTAYFDHYFNNASINTNDVLVIKSFDIKGDILDKHLIEFIGKNFTKLNIAEEGTLYSLLSLENSKNEFSKRVLLGFDSQLSPDQFVEWCLHLSSKEDIDFFVSKALEQGHLNTGQMISLLKIESTDDLKDGLLEKFIAKRDYNFSIADVSLLVKAFPGNTKADSFLVEYIKKNQPLLTKAQIMDLMNQARLAETHDQIIGLIK